MRVIRVSFEVRIDDDGDTTYRVEARHGRSGECPPYHCLHDSHSHSDARLAASDAMNAAVRGALSELTAVSRFAPGMTEIK